MNIYLVRKKRYVLPKSASILLMKKGVNEALKGNYVF